MYPPSRMPGGQQPAGDFQKPGVVFQPRTYQGLQAGLNLIVDAVRPTLGPVHRVVGVEHVLPGKQPELLDSGGTIARRIEQVRGRNLDMGAMFTRHVLWKLQERVGDGTTTAAILLQSIFNQGVAYVAAGGNAPLLRQELEAALGGILAQLDGMARPLSGIAAMTHYANGVGYDRELAGELGQVFDLLGPYGRLEIRAAKGRDLKHEFVEGIYWDEGALHPDFIEDKRNGRTVLLDAAVLATDLEIKEAADTLNLLELAAREGMSGVLLVCKSLEGAALAPLLNPTNRGLVKVVAVKTPGNFSDVQSRALTDLAVLSGARPVLTSAGGSLQSIRLEDFGQARRAWAYRDTFGIVTGKGDPRQVRRHVEALRRGYLGASDLDKRGELEKRLGRMMGGTATLWIGASNQDDYEARKANAERAARALRSALIGGVVPGGGAGLLACRGALLEKHRAVAGDEQRVATRILARALEEPFRVLLGNAGLEAGRIGALLERDAAGCCFDVQTQQVVDAWESGILDSVEVIKQAVRSAVSSAALLLTTDVLVHLKNPPMQYHT